MTDDEKVVMYFVVRSSLKMNGGKVPAQVGHATMFLVEAFHTLLNYHDGEFDGAAIWREWRAGEYGKVTLAASDEDFEALKANYKQGSTVFIVVDNGHTQVAPGSETVLGFWPMRKKDRCDILQRLKPLRS